MDIPLYIGHDYQVGSAAGNTGTKGEITGGVEWQMPQGTHVLIPGRWKPVLHLTDNAGNELPIDSILHVYRKRAAQLPLEFLGLIPYAQFNGVSVQNQQSDLYRESLTIPFGVDPKTGNPFVIRAGEYLGFKVDASVVWDPTYTGTVATFPVDERIG